MMRRARMSTRKPGAYRSTCASTRSAMASCSRPSQTPVMSSSPASPRMRCGMWVYAQADSVPAGDGKDQRSSSVRRSRSRDCRRKLGLSSGPGVGRFEVPQDGLFG